MTEEEFPSFKPRGLGRMILSLFGDDDKPSTLEKGSQEPAEFSAERRGLIAGAGAAVLAPREALKLAKAAMPQLVTKMTQLASALPSEVLQKAGGRALPWLMSVISNSAFTDQMIDQQEWRAWDVPASALPSVRARIAGNVHSLSIDEVKDAREFFEALHPLASLLPEDMTLEQFSDEQTWRTALQLLNKNTHLGELSREAFMPMLDTLKKASGLGDMATFGEVTHAINSMAQKYVLNAFGAISTTDPSKKMKLLDGLQQLIDGTDNVNLDLLKQVHDERVKAYKAVGEGAKERRTKAEQLDGRRCTVASLAPLPEKRGYQRYLITLVGGSLSYLEFDNRMRALKESLHRGSHKEGDLLFDLGSSASVRIVSTNDTALIRYLDAIRPPDAFVLAKQLS